MEKTKSKNVLPNQQKNYMKDCESIKEIFLKNRNKNIADDNRERK